MGQLRDVYCGQVNLGLANASVDRVGKHLFDFGIIDEVFIALFILPVR